MQRKTFEVRVGCKEGEGCFWGEGLGLLEGDLRKPYEAECSSGGGGGEKLFLGAGWG